MKMLDLICNSVALLALFSAAKVFAACEIEWPGPGAQKSALHEAVINANQGARSTNVVLAAPGLASISFMDGKGRRSTAIVSFEFRSAECASNNPESLAKNPYLFRVLSYQATNSIQ